MTSPMVWFPLGLEQASVPTATLHRLRNWRAEHLRPSNIRPSRNESRRDVRGCSSSIEIPSKGGTVLDQPAQQEPCWITHGGRPPFRPYPHPSDTRTTNGRPTRGRSTWSAT